MRLLHSSICVLLAIVVESYGPVAEKIVIVVGQSAQRISVFLKAGSTTK
jgi:hypothetical protein